MCWHSKAQKTITLSSAEAEWMGLSEATKKLIFVLQLLKAMKINVTLQIVVNVDNMGTVFMSKNINTTGHSKHIDERTKYVNEYVEDGVLKIVYVKSEENDAAIFTKNFGSELHGKHTVKLVGEG